MGGHPPAEHGTEPPGDQLTEQLDLDCGAVAGAPPLPEPVDDAEGAAAGCRHRHEVADHRRSEIATRPKAAGEGAAFDVHDLAHDPTDRFRLDLIHQSPRRHRSAEA